MIKRVKRIALIAMLLVLICMLGYTRGKVEATSTTGTYNDLLNYSIENEEVTITGVTNYNETEITIPDKIDGKNVTKIGQSAFYYCSSLQSITIPNTVTKIDWNAFEECKQLKGITLPTGLTSLGGKAFLNCSSLKSIEIPTGVEQITTDTFRGCSSIETINITGSKTKMTIEETSIFGGCDSLISINVNENNEKFASIDGVLFDKYIQKLYIYPSAKKDKEYTIPSTVIRLCSAFENCKYLETLNIPSKVQYISQDGLQGIKNFVVDNNNANFASEDGILYDKGKTVLIKYPTGRTDESYTVKKGTAKLDGYSFAYANNLNSIEISDSVSEVGYCAFLRCKNLKSIKIPNSVKEIGLEAFQECTGLESIQIPNGITTISSEMFNACTNLKTVSIPNNITEIGERAFAYCSNLENINIPESVTNIGNGAFYVCTNLKKISIPSTTKIETSAFWQCDKEKLIFVVVKDSDADKYAKENSIKYAYIDGTSPQPVTVKDTPTTSTTTTQPLVKKGDFKSGNKSFYGNYGFVYKDSYFNASATNYNQSLATMSVCLAFSAFAKDPDTATATKNKYQNEDANVKELLKKCEFNNYYQYNYNKKPTIDDVACAIASKKINNSTLIVIAVRGGGYEAEWGSNFTVGTSGDHQGFTKAANTVYSKIQNYIASNKIKGNVKFWITGYSRAGATSNLLAAKLNTTKCISGVKYDKHSIYAYCIATPAGAFKTSYPHSEKYNNIFSIINYHDPVPLLAPNYWGFDRYGITKVLPFQESSSKLSSYETKMKTRLEKILNSSGYFANEKDKKGNTRYKISDFKNYKAVRSNPLAQKVAPDLVVDNNNKDTLGTFLRKAINCAKYDPRFLTRNTLVNSGLQASMRKKYSDGKLGVIDIVYAVFKEFLPDVYAGVIFNPALPKTAIENSSLLALAHAEPAYYVAWMQSMDPNYVANAKTYFSNGDYRVAKVNCPVDVYVYDSKNKLVASIIKEKVKAIKNSTIVASIDENGQKLIYLPIDENYTIKTTAREKCKTTYTIDEYTGVDSELSRVVNYSQISMKKKETIVSDLKAYSANEQQKNTATPSAVKYVVKKSGKNVKANADLSGNKIQKNIYSVKTKFNKKQGKVIGGGKYTLGDFCQVTAINKPGYDFKGWYIGKKKVSKDTTYRFEVKKNITIEAKYSKCKHKKGTKKVTVKATLKKNGAIENRCKICRKGSK